MSLGIVYYLITVADELLNFSLFFGVIVLCASIISLTIGYVEDVKRSKKLGFILLILFFFLAATSVLIPKKDDCLKIVALHYGQKGVEAISKEVSEFYPMIKELAKKELEKAVKQ